MGEIVISENISLDGVIQDPTDEEGLGRGDWFDRMSSDDRGEWFRCEFAEAMAAEALLMGRRTYDWFVARGWPGREGAWPDRLRDLPKYVVTSSALEPPVWENATALRAGGALGAGGGVEGGGVEGGGVEGGGLGDVARLRRETSGEIVVYGSGQLAQALLGNGLVDELRLMTFPVVVGAGARLFGATDAARPLRRVEVRAVGEALALLTYRADRGRTGDRVVRT